MIPARHRTNLAVKELILMMNEKVWDRCSNCYGTGKIPGRLRPKRRCLVCGGTGYIQNSVLIINLPETKSRVEKTVLQRRQVKRNKPAKRD